MTKLWAVWIIYNEEQFIESSVRSVIDHVDELLFVDGAFENFPHDNFLSTDKTFEIIKRVCVEKGKTPHIIILEKPWKDEMQKRNLSYMMYVPDWDWMLLIDGDMETVWLSGIEEQIRETMKTTYTQIVRTSVDGFTVSVHYYNPNSPHVIVKGGPPRIFMKYPDLHYEFNHYSIFDSTGCNFGKEYNFRPLELIYIEKGHYRNVERRQAVREYQSRKCEQSSGDEHLCCAACKFRFVVDKGELLKCPKCGSNDLVVDTVSGQPFPTLVARL
jgi:hypothetical protein